MASIRENFIWLTVLLVGFGSLAAINLGRGVPHLFKAEIGPGVAVALIIGATAALLAVNALAQWLAVLMLLISRWRHGQRADHPYAP